MSITAFTPTKLIPYFAILIFGITAYNSTGFFQADEQYQIIEFAGLKLGVNQPNDLTWEYHENMRSAFQPTICYFLFSFLKFLQISDPYILTFILRFVSAITAVLILSYFIKTTKKLIVDKFRTAYALLTYFLWFIPFLSVRFSSEIWSGLFFLLALAIHHNQKSNYYILLLTGICLGLAFLCRFQTVFLIIPFSIWLLNNNKGAIKLLFKIFIGFSIILLIGVLIDHWFYEKFVFTPYHYFIQFLNDAKSTIFLAEPWNYYVIEIANLPNVIVGIMIFTSIIILLFKQPKNLFIWCFVFFVILHSFIQHKEERFLFPIAFLLPIILIQGYQELMQLIHNNFIIKIFNISFSIILISINAFGIIVMFSKSANEGRMEITKYIHTNYKTSKINLISCPYANPYNPWGLPMKTYEEKNILYTPINSLNELNDSILKTDAINLVVIRRVEFNLCDAKKLLQKNNFTFKIQSIPPWIEKLNLKLGQINSDEILMLYSK